MTIPLAFVLFLLPAFKRYPTTSLLPPPIPRPPPPLVVNTTLSSAVIYRVVFPVLAIIVLSHNGHLRGQGVSKIQGSESLLPQFNVPRATRSHRAVRASREQHQSWQVATNPAPVANAGGIIFPVRRALSVHGRPAIDSSLQSPRASMQGSMHSASQISLAVSDTPPTIVLPSGTPRQSY
ncbi:hypothetical protein K438DRAFT_1980702 [Mycena galopus ATCC 62051]|nr:hypothetical protein K438DRAFT_1980702 [Mycena galopus ATCC 62051]